MVKKQKVLNWALLAILPTSGVYSVALRRANHRWDREKLLVWLANPEDLVPGQAMGYRLEQEKDRRDVVAYLASLSAQP